MYELGITFPPTYPYVDGDDRRPDRFAETRAPAWCDRVLLSHAAHEQVRVGTAVYRALGSRVPTGDHKPVALYFTL